MSPSGTRVPKFTPVSPARGAINTVVKLCEFSTFLTKKAKSFRFEAWPLIRNKRLISVHLNIITYYN